jgi:hypothetical protein
MVQAAARSGFDFAAADPRSRYWWLKLRWVLDRLEDLNIEKVWQMQHAQHMSVLNYELDQQTFNGHWDRANQLLRDIYQVNFPWMKQAGEQGKQRDVNAMMERWKQKFGDPNDPQVQAYYKKVADAMRRKAKDAQKNMFKDQNKLRNMATQVVKSRREKGK